MSLIIPCASSTTNTSGTTGYDDMWWGENDVYLYIYWGNRAGSPVITTSAVFNDWSNAVK